MSEDRVKRRLREWTRIAVHRLNLAGYEAAPLGSGPFHVCADRPDESLRVRIVFGASEESDVLAVAKSRLPAACRREIWQVSEDGRSVVRVKVRSKT